ncbi:molybdate ABC transporter substrate-binding protein [Kineococcus sp. NPDC059986]|uniref:molybdate ABC transporter substrate-binding protein n=1 Tax=Kineococcus sp. NPDC059986 TaxID=3155538 RepID=UPI00344BCB87
MRGRTRLATGLAVVVTLLTACGGGGQPAADATSSPPASSPAERTLTVFAAASLQKTFTTIGTEFEAAHPGVDVRFSFAGSSDLAAQIGQGAPADVFASADEKNMAKVTAQSLTAGDPVDFATNVLEIATPPGNPAGIGSFADLAKPGVKVVVCAAQVPCGAATETVEKASGVTLAPVSEENSVTDVLGKVTAGEADAGLVYVTDVRGAGNAVTGVPFPESSRAVNTYPVAALKDASDASLASEFVTFVAGEQGRKVLQDAGFGAP